MKVMVYEIWQDNGVSVYFHSFKKSMNDALDEFCAEAGHVDHADDCQQMGLEQSPFNIREVE